MKLANRLTFLLGVMAIITGCTTSWMLDQPPAPPPPGSYESSEADRDLKLYMNGMDAGRRAERGKPKFHGSPAAKGLVDFDLVGEWEAMRYRLPEMVQTSAGPWKARYSLERYGNSFVWDTKDDQGLFTLTGDMPQHLIWESADAWTTREYSINEWSFGMLKVTGDDGELYLFIRTEGGEGDLPKLEYRD